jgi:hypothetical protein
LISIELSPLACRSGESTELNGGPSVLVDRLPASERLPARAGNRVTNEEWSGAGTSGRPPDDALGEAIAFIRRPRKSMFRQTSPKQQRRGRDVVFAQHRDGFSCGESGRRR